MQSEEEGLTGKDGSFLYDVKTNGVHQIKAEKDGFITFDRTLNFGKGFLSLPVSESGFRTVEVPLFPVMEDPQTVYACLSYEGAPIEGGVEFIGES